ncbi:hypothetical protein CMEL01_16727 [Colletotrichum melonis]|uniref:Uncharacterized protein n=1 Tax=Colletotrichum melonis TaxID=1209925 RepID=A0AAI9XLT9_9PEZI|nr:hypothetical protein CMEL01_16727 [Colletotrichum melonis]
MVRSPPRSSCPSPSASELADSAARERAQDELDRQLLTKTKFWDLDTLEENAHLPQEHHGALDVFQDVLSLEFMRRNTKKVTLQGFERFFCMVHDLLHQRLDIALARGSGDRDIYHPTVLFVEPKQLLALGMTILQEGTERGRTLGGFVDKHIDRRERQSALHLVISSCKGDCHQYSGERQDVRDYWAGELADEEFQEIWYCVCD